MQGEIDFQESFKKRMRLLKRFMKKFLEEVVINFTPYHKGARRLIDIENRMKTAILYCGFHLFWKIFTNHQVDYIYVQIKMEFCNRWLYGEIVDGNKKPEYLKRNRS